MNLIILIFIIIYILSVYGGYKFIQRSYSKNGCFRNAETTNWDILLIFIPIANTIISMINIRDNPNKKESNANKFFNIK